VLAGFPVAHLVRGSATWPAERLLSPPRDPIRLRIGECERRAESGAEGALEAGLTNGLSQPYRLISRARLVNDDKPDFPQKTASNIGYCQALAPQAAGTCDASPSDPKEPPGRKPVILGIEFHICMASMSNGDLAFR
jgi:hypothetical protein